MIEDGLHNASKGHENEIPHATADFICFVCGAVFTTDEDRKQHLEKEGHGELHDTTTEEEKNKAINQEKLTEEHTHHI